MPKASQHCQASNMYFIPKDVPLSSKSTTTTTAESTTATTTTSVAEESTTEEDDEEIEEARWTKSYGNQFFSFTELRNTSPKTAFDI